MNYGQLYLDFLDECDPVPAPHPWSRFAGGYDAVRAPQDDRPILTALQQKHPRRDLIRSGVAVSGTSKKLEINPIFLGMPNPIVPLRFTQHGAPFDLITDQGSARRCLPLGAATRDHHVRGAIEESGVLFATFSGLDLVALRAMGLPVASAFGLADFDEHSLQDFRRAFGFTESKPPHVPHQLILVAWSPSKLSRQLPGMLDRTVRSLIDNKGMHGLALHNLLTWQPSAAEIEEITSCCRIGGKSDVVRAMHTSLDQSCPSLVPEPVEPDSTADLLVTGRRLHDVLLRPEASRAARRRRLRDFRQAVDEAFVMPLLERAADEQNLSERSRLAGLAKISGLLYPAAAVTKAKLEKEIIERGLSGDAANVNLQNLLKMFETHHKFSKESD